MRVIKYFIVSLLIFGFIGVLVPLISNANPGWLSGYSYRKKVTISGSSGAGTNYQVKLSIGSSSGGDFHLEGHCTDFPNDIRFTDDDGITLLDYWIEDPTQDPITVWVEVKDSLDNNVDIFVYYGKSGESSASDVNSTFIRVIDGAQPVKGSWHFDENLGTTAYDTSGNNNDGAINGATWTTGKFGSALSFDGENDYVEVPHSASLDITSKEAWTIEAWLKWSTLGISEIINKDDSEYGIGYDPAYETCSGGGPQFGIAGVDSVEACAGVSTGTDISVSSLPTLAMEGSGETYLRTNTLPG